ncbi:MAG TPA: PIN domain-containing protein [Thermoanaerobaculia bacterium]
MPLPLLLDSNVLARVVRPDIPDNQPIAAAVFGLLDDRSLKPCVPEIIHYELRRKLLHLGYRPHQGRRWAREALVLLEDMGGAWGYLPLTTEAMRLAAEIWAQSRIDGQPGAPEENLDIDVILAAQARVAGGHIVTLNERHFKNIADVFDWRSYKPN